MLDLRIYLVRLGAVALLGLSATSHATGLVYQPVDPSFGGNPANGQVLLDLANAQNKYTAPSAATAGAMSMQTPLEQFNSELQQAILSRVASSATNSIIGANGQLVPGTIQTGNFSITISPVSNGLLQVSTTDTSTGATTTFQVSQ